MDPGQKRARAGEKRSSVVFEIAEPEPVDPRQPGTGEPAHAPPSGPTEPVLLFREPEPGGIAAGMRALRGAGAALNRTVRERAGELITRNGPGRRAPRRPPSGRVSGSTPVLLRAVAGVQAVVWSVVGAFFWPPILVGAVVLFSVAHLRAMLGGGTPGEAARRLRRAISFYRRGFSNALDVVRTHNGSPARPMGTAPRAPSSEASPAGRLLWQTGWAVIVWYPVLLGSGVVEWSPLQAWNWMLGWPYQELSADLGGRIVAGLDGVIHAAARLSAEAGVPVLR